MLPNIIRVNAFANNLYKESVVTDESNRWACCKLNYEPRMTALVARVIAPQKLTTLKFVRTSNAHLQKEQMNYMTGLL